MSRNTAAWSLCAITALFGAGCKDWFTPPNPDKGGIQVRCQMVLATRAGDYGPNCLIEDPDPGGVNDDIKPPVEFNPRTNAYGDSLGFATDEPNCNSYTVDACIPNKTAPGTASYDIRKALNSGTPVDKLPTDVRNGFVLFNCALATGWADYIGTGGDPTDDQKHHLYANKFEAIYVINGQLAMVTPGDFLDNTTDQFDLTVGTRPVSQPNACNSDLYVNDSNWKFFVGGIDIHKYNDRVAGMATLDASRSGVVLTATVPMHSPESVGSTIDGDILGDKRNCFRDSNGVDQCDFWLQSGSCPV